MGLVIMVLAKKRETKADEVTFGIYTPILQIYDVLQKMLKQLMLWQNY